MHVFLASSPLQVLNAIEAYTHYDVPVSSRLLVVGSSSQYLGNHVDQVEAAIAFGSWGQIMRVPAARKLVWTRRYITTIDRLKRVHSDIDSVYVGNYRSAVMNHAVSALRPNNTVLLDDGIMTIGVSKERSVGSYLMPAPGFLPRTTLLALGVRLSPIRALEMFTAYDVHGGPNDSVVHCNFTYLKSKLSSRRSNEGVILVGSPVVEDGVMTFNAYIRALRSIVSNYTNSPVTYFAHRRENSKGLEAISRAIDVVVERPQSCLELSLLEFDELPAKIVGLFSSALVTSSSLLANYVGVEAHYVQPSFISPLHRERVESAYAELATYPNLQVITTTASRM